jgi:hypothetical protein
MVTSLASSPKVKAPSAYVLAPEIFLLEFLTVVVLDEMCKNTMLGTKMPLTITTWRNISRYDRTVGDVIVTSPP